MENEYLLFSPSLLKTEVFHLAGIPCQKEEKPKHLSSYQSVLTITDKCVSLQCCTGNAAGNKTGTSAAPQWVVSTGNCIFWRPRHFSTCLFSPNTMDTRGGKLQKTVSLTCQVATKCVSWLCLYFSVHGSLPLHLSGSNLPLHQGTGQNPLCSRYYMCEANTHSGLVTKSWHGQMALQLKDHISSWEGNDKDLLVEEVSQFTGCCPSWKGSSPEHRWV